MLYILTVIILFYGIFKYDAKGKQNIQFSKGLIIWVALLSGLSYKLGTDILRYMDDFNTLYKGSINIETLKYYMEERIQPGWYLLNHFCYVFFGDFTALKIIHAIIVNGAVYYFMNKTKVPQFTFLLFYFLLLWFQIDLNILREGLAISLFLFALPNLIDWNWKKYYLFTFLAFSFHFSAIILFALPLLRFINYQSKITIYIFSSILLIMPLSLSISSLSNVIQSSLYFVDVSADTYSISYLSEDTSSERTLLLDIFRILTMLVPILYVWLKDKSKTNVITGLSLIYVVFYVLSTYILILHRLSQYFEPVYYVILVEFILSISKMMIPKLKNILMFAMIIFYLTPVRMFFIKDTFVQKRYEYVYPYTSIFNKEDAEFRNNILPQ